MTGPHDQSRRLTSSPDITRRGWPWWSATIQVVTLIAAFFLVAAIGARQVARNERVLSGLEPLAEVVRSRGWEHVVWLVSQRAAVGWTITGVAVLIALAGIVVGRLRAMPILLLAAGASLASWGQVMLFADRPQLGVGLYALGAACAVALGVWCPLHRIEGFPQLPLPSRRGQAQHLTAPPTRFPHWGWECLLVVLLSLTALLTRMYALSELPQGFELEMIDAIILSRTRYGLVSYLGFGLTANAAGILHYLPKRLLFELFGTSLYSLRLSAVIFGFPAVPLLYWLVRRMAGMGAAIAATVLLIAAPEQLYWSRIEIAQFAPIAIVGLVAAHLGLWMVERLSIWAVLAAALWTPVSRCAYAPAYILVAYPLLLCSHAVVFVRGAWRKAWYAVPLLAAGVTLWLLSVSIVHWSLNDWHWQFVDPTFIFGAPAWRMHGQAGFNDASLPELMRLQSIAMAEKSQGVITGLWSHGPGMFSQWFQRAYVLPNHATVLNAGIGVIFVLGFGYLLGQLYDRRAFALLVWVGLGVLPAILSDDPTVRRLALAFPAVYAIAGVWVGAACAIVRTRATRWLGWVTAALLGLALAGIAWTSLVSHFRIATGPAWIAPAIRFAQPLFKESDVILHNLDPGVAKGILFGNLDEFLTRAPCYQDIRDKPWLQAALDVPCDYNGYPYPLTMAPARREALQRAYDPRRIAFLLEETSYSRPGIDLLRGLYPRAQIGHVQFGARSLVSMTVDIADVKALHRPVLLIGPAAGEVKDAEAALLDGVRLTRATWAGDETTPADVIAVRGGIFVPRDGWYRFHVMPDCADVRLTLDQQPSSSTEARPMLAGVHPFEMTLPNAAACHWPLQVMMQAHDQSAAIPVGADQFVSWAVASTSAAQAAPVAPYPGFGEARVFASVPGKLEDLGVDGQGFVSVLVVEHGVALVHRFDFNGHEVARWLPEIPPGRALHSMAVEPNGTTIIMTDTVALLYDPAGHRIGTWQTEWAAGSTDIAVSPEGRILLPFPSRQSIAVFSRDGHLQGEIKEFAGGPGRFSEPASVTLGPDGAMAVIQDDGRVLVFRSSGDWLRPTFVSTFRAGLSAVPFFARGGAFDGPTRILIPDPSKPPWAYGIDGQRLMASLPGRDLGMIGTGVAVQLQFAGDRLYALDPFRNQIWSVAR